MHLDHEYPLATYRLQLNKDFRFASAQSLVGYFSRLGVTHIYSSPVLRARQESTHGYDVVDPTLIHPNLGDKTDFRAFVTALQNFGMGLILDIVPNHMATCIENPYWRDVQTYGPSSPFARWFDIDWRMPNAEMWGRVLVPVLGEPLTKVLANDQIRVAWSEGRFLVCYFNHTFPIDPVTVPRICLFGIEDLERRLEAPQPVLEQIRHILQWLDRLPKLAVRVRRHTEISREETEQRLAQLAQWIAHSPQIQQWAEETAERFGAGEEGRRRLRKLLDAQPYRLVFWREAARVINYRRFFDVNELVSVRQEDPHVFDETHATICRWVQEGLVDGLRIDHIDGLRDPLGYLQRLAERVAVDGRRRPVYLFVEKILAHGEKLPLSWPVEGTTGYDFLNQAEALFVSADGFAEIEAGYRHMLRRPVRFDEVTEWGKRRVLRNDLSPHIGRLADNLLRLANRRSQALAAIPSGERSKSREQVAGEPLVTGTAVALLPLERRELRKRDLVDGIVEVIVALSVYRTYTDQDHCTVSEADRRYLETAIDVARKSGRAAPEAIDLLRQVLLLENRSDWPEEEQRESINFIQRFQQLTGPVAAKGIEDTALYAYVPLASLNEVGGEPNRPLEDAAAALHRANEERQITSPRTMLCVTTHDTKRTADVRARLDVLSELPKRWMTLVRRWRTKNRGHQTRIGGRLAPDDVAEYLFYQTLVGIWPAPDPPAARAKLPEAFELQDLRNRIERYMLKAAREAKTRTSWVNPSRAYEDALVSFVRSLLLDDGATSTEFLSDVQNLVARIARPGFWNSLSRTLIQFTSPGTPDLYQGDELWNFALVDPDNRHAVDYERRQRLLDEVVIGIEGTHDARRAFVRSLVESPEDGRIKLHVIRTALQTRRDHPQLFASGDYTQLQIEGARQKHLFAFSRACGDQAVVVAAPRLTLTLCKQPSEAPIGETVWSDTVLFLPAALEGRDWRCVLTQESLAGTSDGSLRIAEVLSSFPVALLMSQ